MRFDTDRYVSYDAGRRLVKGPLDRSPPPTPDAPPGAPAPKPTGTPPSAPAEWPVHAARAPVSPIRYTVTIEPRAAGGRR
ncbi:MAG: hypothetical protein QOF66_4819 [Mycobacterium sp.]|jgi:hypothetical protein|nr:hypothetical protein [Mycobacterium sp.]